MNDSYGSKFVDEGLDCPGLRWLNGPLLLLAWPLRCLEHRSDEEGVEDWLLSLPERLRWLEKRVKTHLE
jgi:hypothetical protein